MIIVGVPEIYPVLVLNINPVSVVIFGVIEYVYAPSPPLPLTGLKLVTATFFTVTLLETSTLVLNANANTSKLNVLLEV